MITGISIVSVWVLDQDAAKEFYTRQLGFDATNDVTMENGMRWLTVKPQGTSGQEFVLMDPDHSMLDAETAQQVRALVAKGAFSPGVLSTTDCRGDYEALVAQGWSSPRRQPIAPTGLRLSSATTPGTGSASPNVTVCELGSQATEARRSHPQPGIRLRLFGPLRGPALACGP
jgi:catechol 2,3-dioxygenase-like lactoylglutathione lyase family enzyme